MIDPFNVTNYNRTQAQLQEWLLFSIFVAGKKATTQAAALDRFLNGTDSDGRGQPNHGFSCPFLYLTHLVKRNRLDIEIEACRVGHEDSVSVNGDVGWDVNPRGETYKAGMRATVNDLLDRCSSRSASRVAQELQDVRVEAGEPHVALRVHDEHARCLRPDAGDQPVPTGSVAHCANSAASRFPAGGSARRSTAARSRRGCTEARRVVVLAQLRDAPEPFFGGHGWNWRVD